MSSDQQEPVKTICPYCGVGCGIKVQPGEEPGDVQFMPWGDAPVNEGRICIKGGAATEVVDHEDRLTDPLIKEEGSSARPPGRRPTSTSSANSSGFATSTARTRWAFSGPRR